MGPAAGRYIAPQAARRPLSSSVLCNPRQKVLFARLGRGGPWGGPGESVARLPYELSKKVFYFTLDELRESAGIN